jgi:hypothetical protein
MPSPNGTNREGLFIDTPVAAYDALPPDFKPSLNADELQEILDFLKKKLSDADYQAVEKMIFGEMNGEDQPTDFPGKPSTAMDKLPPRVRAQALKALDEIRTQRAENFRTRWPVVDGIAVTG